MKHLYEVAELTGIDTGELIKIIRKNSSLGIKVTSYFTSLTKEEIARLKRFIQNQIRTKTSVNDIKSVFEVSKMIDMDAGELIKIIREISSLNIKSKCLKHQTRHKFSFFSDKRRSRSSESIYSGTNKSKTG